MRTYQGITGSCRWPFPVRQWLLIVTCHWDWMVLILIRRSRPWVIWPKRRSLLLVTVSDEKLAGWSMPDFSVSLMSGVYCVWRIFQMAHMSNASRRAHRYFTEDHVSHQYCSLLKWKQEYKWVTDLKSKYSLPLPIFCKHQNTDI